MTVESAGKDVVEGEHHFADCLLAESVDKAEIIIVIKYVQIVYNRLVGKVVAGEGDHLVKDGAGIAQTSVGFLRDHVKGFRLKSHFFVLCHKRQVIADVFGLDPVKVEDLAAGKNGGK